MEDLGCRSDRRGHYRGLYMDLTSVLGQAKYHELVEIVVERQQEEEGEEKDEGVDSIFSRPYTPGATLVTWVARLDEQHGGVQWIPLDDSLIEPPASSAVEPQEREVQERIDNTDSDTTPGTPALSQNRQQLNTHQRRFFQTKKWVLPMLNDHTRNQLYQQAIRDAFHTLLPSTSPSSPLHILEIGTGTGLLALLAAQSMGQVDPSRLAPNITDRQSPRSFPLNLTSVEMAAPMALVAQQVWLDNSQDGPLSTANTMLVVDHSINIPSLRASPSLPAPQLCLSELLTSDLLSEGWLPTLRDAWQRHLLLPPPPPTPQHDPEEEEEKGGATTRATPSACVVIPQGATVFIQVVQGEWLQQAYGPHSDGGLSPGPTHTHKHEEEHQKHSPTSSQEGHGFHPDSSTMVRPVPIRLSWDAPANATAQDTSDVMSSETKDEREGADTKTESCWLEAEAIQWPVHGKFLLEQGSLVALCPPTPVLTVDVQRPDSPSLASGPGYRTASVRRTCLVETSGTMHGVLLSWDLNLFQNKYIYSTRPDSQQPWQDHWHNCLYVIPCEKSRWVAAGTSVTVSASHDDDRIYIELASEVDDPSTNPKRPRPTREENGVPSARISPERCLQLHDPVRWSVLQRALAASLAVKGKAAPLLDVSDLGLCACLAAAALGASRVTSLETSTSEDFVMMAARLAQVANRLPRPGCHFNLVHGHPEELTLKSLAGSSSTAEPFQIVVAEPYYEMMERWPFLEALNFYYMVKSFRSRGLLAPDAIVLPGQGHWMACAVESFDLDSAYRPCGELVPGSRPPKYLMAGLDHTAVNEVAARFHEFDLSLPLWQYRIRPLSKPVRLLTLDYAQASNSSPDQLRSQSRIPLHLAGSAGTCHALMMWMEYEWGGAIHLCSTRESGEEDKVHDPGMVLSTRGRPYNQVVRMLAQPVVIPDVHARQGASQPATSDGPLHDNDPTPFHLVVETIVGGLGSETHQFLISVEGMMSNQRDAVGKCTPE